jgi:hypothetical protein
MNSMQHWFVDLDSLTRSSTHLIHWHCHVVDEHNLYTNAHVKVSSPCSWKPMVLFIWTKFDTWLMDYIDLPFAIKSYGLALVASFVLKRSSNEFIIFPTFLDVCCSFTFSPTLQLHLDSSLLQYWLCLIMN